MNMFAKMFKTEPVVTATPTTPTTTIENKGLSAPNPTVGVDGKIPGEITPVNPLDAYKKMYDNANASSDIHAPSFKLDPKVLGEVSSTMDFTKNINPELVTKALAGDAKSLIEMMQSVGRNAYSASLEHATTLTETHLGQRAAFEGQRVDQGVKKQLTSDALSTAPSYEHPVVKAELNRVADMFAKANPDASPQQIAKAAQKHITELSAALNPASKSTVSKDTDENGVDWTKYLSS